VRIPLASEPNVTRSAEPEPSALDSWRHWVAAKAPREPPAEPDERIRLLNNLQPYQPRWEP
jgi:hypothetical protein